MQELWELSRILWEKVRQGWSMGVSARMGLSRHLSDPAAVTHPWFCPQGPVQEHEKLWGSGPLGRKGWTQGLGAHGAAGTGTTWNPDINPKETQIKLNIGKILP